MKITVSGMCHRVVWYLVSNVSDKRANVVFSSTLGMDKAGSSVTLVSLYQTALRHTTETGIFIPTAVSSSNLLSSDSFSEYLKIYIHSAFSDISTVQVTLLQYSDLVLELPYIPA